MPSGVEISHCLFPGRGVIVFPVFTGSDRQNADRIFSPLYSRRTFVCAHIPAFIQNEAWRGFCIWTRPRPLWERSGNRSISRSLRYQGDEDRITHLLKRVGGNSLDDEREMLRSLQCYSDSNAFLNDIWASHLTWSWKYTQTKPKRNCKGSPQFSPKLKLV